MAVAQMVQYTTDAGQTMSLDPMTVKNYLVNGGGNVTDQETLMFLKLCEAKRLNPFLREAYLIKFGNNPATIVTGKDYFTKKANQNGEYEGFAAGVIVEHGDELLEREGTIVMRSEELIGGWATVYRKDRKVPIKNTAMLTEYVRTKADGSVMANWKSMPATMIRKVALVQSLREAFPEDFGGLYSPDEMPVDVSTLPDRPIEVTAEVVTMASEKQQKKIHIEAKRLGWSELKLTAGLKHKYGKERTRDLTLSQASELIDMLTKTETPAAPEPESDAFIDIPQEPLPNERIPGDD